MNALQLALKPGQELFEGEYRTKMAELRQAGYTPWSTEDWMDARNGVDSDNPLWNNYGDTDFGIAGSKQKIYLMPHSERLRAVTPQTRLIKGGLSFTQDGAVSTYNRGDLILGRDLTEEQARTSPVWLDFAAGDQKQLDRYVEKTFRFGKDKFNYDTMMGIFVPEDEVERAVLLYRLNYSSRAYGSYHLGNNTRFVGVRRGSEATKVPAGRDAQTVSPYRKDPRSDLEIFLSEHSLSKNELYKAVELYKTVKELKV
ncbi:MAG: hypothetical protein AABY40_01815 [Nanoarchaeota archaeon]